MHRIGIVLLCSALKELVLAVRGSQYMDAHHPQHEVRNRGIEGQACNRYHSQTEGIPVWANCEGMSCAG